ncbi:DNA-directed RNA polymerase 1, mitochondrial-like [Vicia villosa]|uniref:DNA-directed RNA polymerase 1, mitochondrial-like n=1 Tax=Vicia villosa TaxID=3911 RepID=UPI00273B7265|nr:DNA-directed RNA polymerase 1, mitochondrial-like [Vicia villosa]
MLTRLMLTSKCVFFKLARHMVIPYMLMLVPPNHWTGYDKGAYLFLPSYVMRIHGAKQQREAVKRDPKNQLDPIFEALNTLDDTKWRVNKSLIGRLSRNMSKTMDGRVDIM